MKEVKIKTADKDGENVVNVILRVSEEGQIKKMFGVGERGGREVTWQVTKIKFTLTPPVGRDRLDRPKPLDRRKRRPSDSVEISKSGTGVSDNNDECKCCTVQNGQIVCVTCACEG